MKYAAPATEVTAKTCQVFTLLETYLDAPAMFTLPARDIELRFIE